MTSTYWFVQRCNCLESWRLASRQWLVSGGTSPALRATTAENTKHPPCTGRQSSGGGHRN
eukprot:3751917-Amphidinium_carterae.1